MLVSSPAARRRSSPWMNRDDLATCICPSALTVHWASWVDHGDPAVRVIVVVVVGFAVFDSNGTKSCENASTKTNLPCCFVWAKSTPYTINILSFVMGNTHFFILETSLSSPCRKDKTTAPCEDFIIWWRKWCSRKVVGVDNVDVRTSNAHSGGRRGSPASVVKTNLSWRLCVAISSCAEIWGISDKADDDRDKAVCNNEESRPYLHCEPELNDILPQLTLFDARSFLYNCLRSIFISAIIIWLFIALLKLRCLPIIP